MLNGFLWWTGALFWLAWVGVALAGGARFVKLKWRGRHVPAGSWYGTPLQRRKLAEARAEAHRVLYGERHNSRFGRPL